MGKLTLLAGGAIGYVLGTRAGRERFEQIKSQAQTLWDNPKVQEQASKVQGVAKRKTSEVQDKVSSSSSPSSTSPSTSPGSVSSAGTADIVDSPGSLRTSAPTEPAPFPTSSTTGLA